jgi:hypothetical protein
MRLKTAEERLPYPQVSALRGKALGNGGDIKLDK